MYSPSGDTRLRLGLAAGLALLILLPAPADGRSAASVQATEVCEIQGDTTWGLADSPFRTTCSPSVADGVTLTIEPGVTVQMGPFHSLNVAGRLLAEGQASAPIIFEASGEGITWGGIQLLAGSGPTEIAHAQFRGGGSGRREMLGIATDAALVRDSEFGRSAGVAVEIRNASPTVRGSRFLFASDSAATPPAALRILGASEPVISANYFQSNNLFGVSMEMNASPRFSGNRFLYNGFDGVLVYGNLNRAVRWSNLGNRGWAYQASRSQLTIEPGGHLTIEPGATLKFAAGLGMRVSGTLAVRGAAASPVYIGTNVAVPRPGSWREIWFLPDSDDFDPETGEGSVIEHAIIEYGSSQPNGQIWIQGASPRIAHTVLRHAGQRGLVINGPDAAPDLTELTLQDNADNVTGGDGIGLLITDGATPTVSWSTFMNNKVGVRTESGANPRLGPHNVIGAHLGYGVFNNDFDVCVDATGNDWGAANGPRDTSDRFDACDQGRNDGNGSLVSDHVRYSDWEGTLVPRPQALGPQCGLQTSDRPTLSGYAPSGSTVAVFDNHTLIGTTTAGAGQEEGPWSFTPAEALARGSHVIRVQASRDDLVSAVSAPLPLQIDPNQPIQPAGIAVSFEVDGGGYVQPFQDASGCLTLNGDGSWPIRPLSGVPVTLHVPVSCPGGVAPSGTARYNDRDYPLTGDGSGRLAATFDQDQGGTLSVQVACGDAQRDFFLGTLNPEFDGFVYDLAGGVLDRIAGAKVTLYVSDRATRQWVPWNGAVYHGQTNPVVTGQGGRFAFYPQPGLYRVLVEAPGYPAQFGPPIQVTVNPYVANIGLDNGRRGGVYLPIAHR